MPRDEPAAHPPLLCRVRQSQKLKRCGHASLKPHHPLGVLCHGCAPGCAEVLAHLPGDLGGSHCARKVLAFERPRVDASPTRTSRSPSDWPGARWSRSSGEPTNALGSSSVGWWSSRRPRQGAAREHAGAAVRVDRAVVGGRDQCEAVRGGPVTQPGSGACANGSDPGWFPPPPAQPCLIAGAWTGIRRRLRSGRRRRPAPPGVSARRPPTVTSLGRGRRTCSGPRRPCPASPC